MEELIDVLDEDGIFTGVVSPRSEVQAIRFVSLSELSKMIEQGELVPCKYVYDVLKNYLFRM